MNGTRVLAAVLGFWILMRAINKDSTGRTLIDHLLQRPASQSPLLSAALPSSSTSSSTAGTGSVLASLFPAGTSITPKRQDQGRDLQAPANTLVLAPGNGSLVRNGYDPSGFGDSYPIVHFTTGPWAGEDVYFGHTKSLLSGNQTIAAGQPLAQTQNGNGPYVGNATGLPGWLEVGLAPGGTPGPFDQPLPAGLGTPAFSG